MWRPSGKRVERTVPDVLAAARAALAAGADSITVHLREDRRHIQDMDLARLAKETGLRLNLEMAATEEMVRIARVTHPASVCLVPEKRQELNDGGRFGRHGPDGPRCGLPAKNFGQRNQGQPLSSIRILIKCRRRKTRGRIWWKFIPGLTRKRQGGKIRAMELKKMSRTQVRWRKAVGAGGERGAWVGL
jgi:hypothetical protein